MKNKSYQRKSFMTDCPICGYTLFTEQHILMLTAKPI